MVRVASTASTQMHGIVVEQPPRPPEPLESAALLGAAGTTRAASSPARPRDDYRAIVSLFVSGAHNLDPMAMLAAMQSELRNTGAEAQEVGISANETQAAAAQARQEVKLEEAAKALEKAMSKLPPWAKKLIGAVVAAVAAVASVYTGGASLALVVVAVGLIAAGEVIQLLAEKGIIDEKRGLIAATVLKIVGAIVMTIASAGVGAANSATGATTATQAGVQAAQTGAQAGAQAASVGAQASQAAQVLEKVSSYVQDFVELALAVQGVRHGLARHDAAHARLDAEEQGIVVDEAVARVEDHVEQLEQLHERFERVVARLVATIDVRDEGGMAAARGFA